MKKQQIVIDAVGSAFLRVMKNENCLDIFKKSFIEYCKHENETFGEFHSFNGLMNKINQIAQENPQRVPNANPKYNHITTMINLLLHYFLENKGVDFQMLGCYGEKIFDLACYKIFGDAYLQERQQLESENPILRQLQENKHTDPLDYFIFNLYQQEVANNPNLNWDLFYRKAKDKLSYVVSLNH